MALRVLQTMAQSIRSPMPLPHERSAAFRHSRRITITLPNQAFLRLLERSDDEGRSLSNLAAFLLENALAGSSSGQLGLPRF